VSRRRRAARRLGTREISLIGGEAYLRRDWLDIVRAIRAHGIYCAVQTGARNLTDRRLKAAVAAGLQGLGVSIDGLPETHDRIRGVEGSHAMAISALERARALGLNTSVNTVIGALNIGELPELLERILDAGARQWQVQLTVAMGNAVDNPELLLQPYQLLDLMPLLARLYHRGQERGLLLTAGNNVGYFGPFERLWRSFDELRGHWTGCSAGQTVIGLESDGTVKGCPSLATEGYAGGNVRDLTLEQIWDGSEERHFGRLRSADSLWGFCRTCYYADVCRGGCTWTADSLFGRPGNNPFCHHRTLELAGRGLRERVVKRRDAPDRGRSPSASSSWCWRRFPGAKARLRPIWKPARPPPAVATWSRSVAGAPGGSPPLAAGGCRRSSASAAPAIATSSPTSEPARTAAAISWRHAPSTSGRASAGARSSRRSRSCSTGREQMPERDQLRPDLVAGRSASRRLHDVDSFTPPAASGEAPPAAPRESRPPAAPRRR
jgi:radical SAM protein with 4Fe4S-binding SPASM domain